MFGFLLGLFKRREPPEPPTENQRRYAAKLGIPISPNMTKGGLSKAISEAERKNPAAAEKRSQIKEKVKRRVREKRFGKELVDQEERWNHFAAEIGYMLAIYTEGRETVVDVLYVSDVFIDPDDGLCLDVEGPDVIKGSYKGGNRLIWDQRFDLPIKSLHYHEALHRKFDSDGNHAYRKAIQKGLKIARKLK
jgi:hypothetical protein